MQVETVQVTTLVADPANARKHAAKNLEAIKGSLAKFGQQKPIVVGQGNVVIAGNGTLEAARSLGWTEINVVRTALTGPEAIAFAIADNRTGELAEWDAGVLSETLKSLQEMDFDLGSIGFDDKDLAGMIASPEPAEGLTDPDEVPENAPTRCKPGDLWILGGHRLLCGDSTNVQHVERLMGGEKADMVFTDPPYGISYQSNFRKEKFDELKNDDVVLAEWIGLADAFTKTWVIFFCAWQRLDEWLVVGKALGKLTNLLIWKKSAAMGDLAGQFAPTYEVALAYNRGGKLRDGVRKSAVFEHNIEQASNFDHPTQKPIALLVDILGGLPDGLVLDLFLGSGSTLIACEKTGRRCFGMELDPKYCDVILARWEAFTGQTASLITGENSGCA